MWIQTHKFPRWFQKLVLTLFLKISDFQIHITLRFVTANQINPNLRLKTPPIPNNCLPLKISIYWFHQFKSKSEIYLSIKNPKYPQLTPVFRLHNIHLKFFTYQNKYKWILCTKNPVLNTRFQDFWCMNINKHLICFEKEDKYILK